MVIGNRCGLAAIALLMLVPELLAGASLAVTVKDPSGSVVAGAKVTATATGWQLPVSAETDTQGRVHFDQLAAGSYHVSVIRDGFEPSTTTVALTDKPVELTVSLKLKMTTTTVQVSAKRSPLADSDPNYAALRGGKLTKVYRIDNLVLQRDVGTFTFRTGSFSFLPPVMGHVTTGVFVGEGNFQLKPGFDLAVKHLQRIAGMDTVDEDFTALVVYFSDATFDEVKQHSELADEAPQRHEEAFKRIKDILENRREPSILRGAPPLTLLQRTLSYEDIPNYDAEILAELYNPAQRGSFRAFLHGKKHADLRFLMNPRGAMPTLAAPEETALLNFDPNSETDGIWYLSHLASELQSGRASSNEDKRLIAPEHYQLQVFVGRENVVGTEPDMLATCDLRFRSLDEGTRMVKFDLVPDLQVSRVTWNGKEIPFIQESRKRDGSFYLQMPEPLVKGQTYQVGFEYSGGEILQSHFGFIPPRRIWYPMPAGTTSRATYDIYFHIPHGMRIVSVGKKIQESREGGLDVSEWSSEVPIPQAVFRYVGDVFQKAANDETTGMDLAAYVTSTRMPTESAHDVLIDAGNSVHIFNYWFGPPAFDALSVLVGAGTDSLPGLVYASPVAMAGYSSLVSQSLVQSRGRGRGGPPATLRIMLDEAFPREVARQWFGNTVGSVSFHDAWLSSGFANFAASLYDLEANSKDTDFKEHWTRARELLLQANRFGVRPNDAGPVWMGLLNDTFKTPNASNTLAIYKGGYILHMLRSMMWDPKTVDDDFRAMMRDYVKQFTGQAISTENFISVVEKHMKPAMDLGGNHRMDWFFGEWLLGTDVPSYRLEYSVTPEKDGKPLLSVKLTQSGVSAGFRMPVPVFVDFGSKRIRLGAVEIHGNSTGEFKVRLPEMPKRVLINLNHDVLTDREEVKLVK